MKQEAHAEQTPKQDSDFHNLSLAPQGELKFSSFEQLVVEEGKKVVVNSAIPLSVSVESWEARLDIDECMELHKVLSDKCDPKVLAALSKTIPFHPLQNGFNIEDTESVNKFFLKRYAALEDRRNRYLPTSLRSEGNAPQALERYRNLATSLEEVGIVEANSSNLLLHLIFDFDNLRLASVTRLTSGPKEFRPASSTWTESADSWVDAQYAAADAKRVARYSTESYSYSRDNSWVKVKGNQANEYPTASRLYVNFSENVDAAKAIDALIAAHTSLGTMDSANFKACTKTAHFDKLVCYLTAQHTKDVDKIVSKLQETFGEAAFDAGLVAGRKLAQGIHMCPTEDAFQLINPFVDCSFHQAIMCFVELSYRQTFLKLGMIESPDAQDYAAKVFTDFMQLTLLGRQ